MTRVRLIVAWNLSSLCVRRLNRAVSGRKRIPVLSTRTGLALCVVQVPAMVRLVLVRNIELWLHILTIALLAMTVVALLLMFTLSRPGSVVISVSKWLN